MRSPKPAPYDQHSGEPASYGADNERHYQCGDIVDPPEIEAWYQIHCSMEFCSWLGRAVLVGMGNPTPSSGDLAGHPDVRFWH